jgi:hypothetical protein
VNSSVYEESTVLNRNFLVLPLITRIGSNYFSKNNILFFFSLVPPTITPTILTIYSDFTKFFLFFLCFFLIMFIHTKRKENTVQLRVSNRGDKRRTWLIRCRMQN